MSPWLLAVVAVLAAAFLVLRWWTKESSGGPGAAADDRAIVVSFERSTAQRGAALLDAALRLFEACLKRDGVAADTPAFGPSQAFDVLRAAARDLVDAWPSDPLAPGEPFSFLRASTTLRHPVLRVVSDEGGHAALQALAEGDFASASSAAADAARAWIARIGAARRRLEAAPESAWTSLTLVSVGMMDLEPDSRAEEVVGARVRSVLRDHLGEPGMEAAVAAALWMLSTATAHDRADDGSLPIGDASLAAIVARLLAQQASKASLDQRARAIAAGHWDLLWLAWELARGQPDNDKAARSFRALRQAAAACTAGNDTPIRRLEAEAAKHLEPPLTERVVQVARTLAAGSTQDEVLGKATGHEARAKRHPGTVEP